MSLTEALWVCTLTINAVLIIGILHQRTQIARLQHAITQNMIALKQAEKILKGKKDVRTYKRDKNAD